MLKVFTIGKFRVFRVFVVVSWPEKSYHEIHVFHVQSRVYHVQSRAFSRSVFFKKYCDVNGFHTGCVFVQLYGSTCIFTNHPDNWDCICFHALFHIISTKRRM